jgi:hypothetical protein
MSRLGQLLPDVVTRELKRVLPCYRRFYFPVCDHWDHVFQTFGLIPRVNARCPTCGALERHRLIWPFFGEHTDLSRAYGGGSVDRRPARALFGQVGRVRKYGPVFRGPVEGRRLWVGRYTADDVVAGAARRHLAIGTSEGPVFLCRREA